MIKGNVDDDTLSEFRHSWKAQNAGVENAWKIPIMQAEDMDWIDLQKTNRDMEFSNWQEYLIRLSCALYKIDPKEIGFDLGSGKGGTTYESKQEYKFKYSKDKGLYPLLKFYQRKINKMIIGPLSNDKYEFVWTGIEDDENIQLDNDIQKVTNFMGVKEMRKNWNLPPELDKDDIILNPVWVQMKQAEMQAKQFGSPDSNMFMDGQAGADVVSQASNPFLGQTIGGQQILDKEGNPFENSEEDQVSNPFMDEVNMFMKAKLFNKDKKDELIK